MIIFLLIHQNSKSGNLLGDNCNVQSETISMKYSYSSYQYIKINWSTWMGLFFMSDSVTHALVIWKILLHWVIQIFQMLTHFVIWYQQIILIYITLVLLEKPLTIGKLSNSQWQIQIFQNSKFCLIALILLLPGNTISCFPWTVNLIVHFWQYICQIPKSK